MKELWRPVDQFHEISNLGRVRSLDRLVNNGTGQRLVKGQILKPSLNNKGYPFVGIGDKSYLVHRLVALAFIPNPENKPEVNHIDNDPSNPQANNLEWTTRFENMAHMVRQDRHHHAERHWKAKLTPEQVIEIRQLRANGMSCMELAIRFNLHSSYVDNLVKGKTWAHIPLYTAPVKV